MRKFCGLGVILENKFLGSKLERGEPVAVNKNDKGNLSYLNTKTGEYEPMPAGSGNYRE